MPIMSLASVYISQRIFFARAMTVGGKPRECHGVLPYYDQGGLTEIDSVYLVPARTYEITIGGGRRLN
jgi:hypothetical protein